MCSIIKAAKNIIKLFSLFLITCAFANADTTYVSTLSGSNHWTISGSPYVVTQDIKAVYGGLYIDPGVEVLFYSGAGLKIADDYATDPRPGWLNAVGTPDSVIRFAPLSGISGDWDGITFEKGSGYSTYTSTLEHCIIEKGHLNIYCRNTAQPTLHNCIIRGADHSGIYLSNSNIVEVSNCQIDSNALYGVYFTPGLFPNLMGNTYSDNGMGIAMSGGDFSASGTLKNDNNEPYNVLGDIRLIFRGLALEPGITMLFDTSAGLQVGGDYINDPRPGWLNAVGTPDSVIRFAPLSGISGDWDGITFEKGSGYSTYTSTLEHCIIEKGHLNIYCRNTAQPTLHNCIIRGADHSGIYLSNSNIVEVSNCQIDSNALYGVYFTPGLFPNLMGNTYSDNGMGIAMSGGDFSASGTLKNDNNEPYNVLGDIRLIFRGLALEPGITMLFDTSAGLQVGGDYINDPRPGWLNAVGTPDSVIRFAPLSGISGDWDGITFEKGSGYSTYTSTLEHCIIEKGHLNIYCRNTAQPTLHNCIIRGADHSGIYLSNSNIVEVSNCQIDSNAAYGVYIYGTSQPHIGDSVDFTCFIQNNPNYNLYNNTANSIYVRHNYWGTSDPDTIAAYIYDYFDEDTKGRVYYEPFIFDHNVGIISILEPTGIGSLVSVYVPTVILKNKGANQESGSAVFEIGDVYSEIVGFNLEIGQEDTISFPEWIPSELAAYFVTCSINLPDDLDESDNTFNDKISLSSGSGLEIHTIFPDFGRTGQFVTVSITGNGFESSGMGARLKLPGEPDIIADVSDINFINENTIEIGFDLTDAILDRWDIEISNSLNETYRFYKGLNVIFYEGEVLPLCEWHEFNVHDGSTIDAGGVLISKSEEIFMLLKKGNRSGYSGTWSGTVRLLDYEGNQIAYSTGGADVAFHCKDLSAGLYTLEIEAYDPGEGIIDFCSEIQDSMTIGQWYIGEILRPYGNDWVQFDLPEGIDTLHLQTEGYGMWSTIDVYLEDLNNPTGHWFFNNPPRGYHIEGKIANPPAGRYFIKYMDSAVLQGTGYNQKRQYMLLVDTSSSPPPPQIEPEITGLSTYEGGQGPVTVIVSGRGLDSLATVYLAREGYDDVIAEYVYGDSNMVELIATFDFSETETGDWEFIVENPGGQSDTSSDLFTVDQSISENVQIELVGRESQRINRSQTYLLKITNNGIINVYDRLLWLTMSENATFEFLDVSTPYNKPPHSATTFNGVKVLGVVLPLLEAGAKQTIPIKVYANGGDNIAFSAGIVDVPPPYYLLMKKGPFNHYDYSTNSIFSTLPNRVQPYYNDPPLQNGLTVFIGPNYGSGGDNPYGHNAITEVVNGELKVWDPFLKSAGYNQPMNFADWRYYFESDGAEYKGWGKPVDATDDKLNEVAALARQEVQNNEVEWSLYGFAGKYMTCSRWIQHLYAKRDLHPIPQPFAWPWITPGTLYLAMTGRSDFYSVLNPSKNLRFLSDLSFILDYYPEWSETWLGKALQSFISKLIQSSTPEDKYGPTGFDLPDTPIESKKRHLSEFKSQFDYRIDFWNHEEATADAQVVYIKDTLDENFDIYSFGFTKFGFLRWDIDLGGGQYFNVDVDMRPDMDLIVNVEGTFDPDNRAIDWVFTSMVPGSDTLPELIGFLPPIDSTGYNMGWVDFKVSPKSNLITGTQFTNQAFVNFDGYPACDTCPLWSPAPKDGPYLNTLDAGPPQSQITTLPDTTYDLSILVDWSGVDDDEQELGSGIKSYNIYYSDNGGPYVLWLNDTTATSAVFTGCIHDHTYAFYSLATDNVGHVESPPDSFDTKTTISYFFVCGDVAQPNDGLVNLLDILFLINYLYGNPQGDAPDPIEAADVNFDGENITVNLIDILYLIDFIYGEPHGPEPDCAGQKKRSVPSAPVDTAFIACNTKNGKSTINIDSPVDIFGIELKLRSADSSQITLTNQSNVFDLFYRQEKSAIKAGMLNPKEKQLLPKGKNVLLEASGTVEVTDVLAVDASLNPVYLVTNSVMMPKEFQLSQNYPNPFNPTTTIEFALPIDTDVRLEVYNILGQRVATLINERLGAGYHSILWDGRNASGEEVASGVYFYRIITDKFIKSKKMVVLK